MKDRRREEEEDMDEDIDLEEVLKDFPKKKMSRKKWMKPDLLKKKSKIEML